MLNSDFQKLSVTGLITLYEIDATKLGAGIFRWHGHTSQDDISRIYAWAGRTDRNIGNTDENVGKEYDGTGGSGRDLIWQGQIYSPVAIKSDGLEMRGDGRASTPTLALSNNIDGIPAAVSTLCMQYDDFAGAKLTVINTLAKYLDAENFSDGNSQAANEYRQQIWYVEQKTSENISTVTFELSNPVDFEGAKIPSRDITSYCHWAVHGRYRGQECGYTGVEMFDRFDNPVTDIKKDRCSGRLSSCKIRFGELEPLPFGGFPSSNLLG